MPTALATPVRGSRGGTDPNWDRSWRWISCAIRIGCPRSANSIISISGSIFLFCHHVEQLLEDLEILFVEARHLFSIASKELVCPADVVHRLIDKKGDGGL